MNDSKLKHLDELLKERFNDYISMIAVGSIVVGDPYIPRRSDKDILLVFNIDPLLYVSKIEPILTSIKFDDSYVFIPLCKTDFGRADSKYSFSNRFRSRTLFGADLVKLSELPESDVTKIMYENGLESTLYRISNCLVNSGSWSEHKIRNILWKEFKHAFMYLSIREYYQTQEYPVRRKDLADRLNVKEINYTFNVLHSIDEQSKEIILDCARNLTAYLVKIKSY